jgi:two-component system, NarL family, sensor kinase
MEAHPVNAVEVRARDLARILFELEGRRLGRLEQLSAAERRLALSVRRKRGDEGRRAIRQIERDRQRLAGELHTGVGQLLAAIRIQVGIVEAHVRDLPPQAGEALQRISTIADEALDQVRAVSRRLHPPQWQRLPLDAALRHLWDLAGVSGRFEGAASVEPLDFDPGVEVKSLFYRAAQEALSNAMQHSRATRIELLLRRVRNRLVLQVRDNGVGFDVARVLSAQPGAATGIGLTSVREQSRAIRGKLLIKSTGLGTTLEVSVGLPRAFA